MRFRVEPWAPGMEDLKATGLGLQDAGVRICTSGFHDFMVEDFKVRRADGALPDFSRL